MSKMSRDKGKRGELEFAKLLRDEGFTAARGQQYSGGADSPDVVHNVPGVHFEVKRVERLNLKAAMDQADNDADPKDIPVVAHRKNHEPWYVTMFAEDFLLLLEQDDD